MLFKNRINFNHLVYALQMVTYTKRLFRISALAGRNERFVRVQFLRYVYYFRIFVNQKNYENFQKSSTTTVYLEALKSKFFN